MGHALWTLGTKRGASERLKKGSGFASRAEPPVLIAGIMVFVINLMGSMLVFRRRPLLNAAWSSGGSALSGAGATSRTSQRRSPVINPGFSAVGEYRRTRPPIKLKPSTLYR